MRTNTFFTTEEIVNAIKIINSVQDPNKSVDFVNKMLNIAYNEGALAQIEQTQNLLK